VRRRFAVLAGWVMVLLVGVLVIVRTNFIADMSAFLPAAPDAGQRVLVEQVQHGIASRMLLLGIEGGDATTRAEASRSLARALRADAAFTQVQNGDTAAWNEAGTWIFDHRYLLSPAVDTRRFSPEGLTDALLDTVSLLGTPAGNALKAVLDRDPTGESLRIAEAMLPPSAPRVEQGVWVSRDVPRALLLVVTAAPGDDIDAQAAAVASVQATFERLPVAEGLALQMAGAPVYAIDSRARIETEVRRLAIGGVLVMSLLLWLAFGRLRALALAGVPVVSGVVAGIAAVSLVHGSVHGLTLGFGSTLIGEAVDYAIYFLVQSSAGAARTGMPGTGWRVWVRENWPTVRLGLWTSVCGFAALLWAGFPGLAQLGVFSLSGLAAAAAVARWVMPALAPDGAAGGRGRRVLGQGGAALVNLATRSRWVWVGLIVLAALWLASRPAPLWTGTLRTLSPVPASTVALDESLRADLGANDAGVLLAVTGDDDEATLQRCEAVVQVLNQWQSDGRLAGYDSPTRLLPSLATQQERRASLPDRATLEASLSTAAPEAGLAASRLQPFISDVEAARQSLPIMPEDVRQSPLGPVLEALLQRRPQGGTVALMPLYPASTAAIDAAALKTALGSLPGVTVMSIGPELDAIYARYLRNAAGLAAAGAVAVMLLLAWHLRSLGRLLAIGAPLAGAVLLALAFAVAIGEPLGVLHLVGLLLVVAVGSNYALFFDALAHPKVTSGPAGDETASSDAGDTLASLVLANLTTVISFGLIALSGIPVLSAIGRIVAPGALLAMLLAAAFVGLPRRGDMSRRPDAVDRM